MEGCAGFDGGPGIKSLPSMDDRLFMNMCTHTHTQSGAGTQLSRWGDTAKQDGRTHRGARKPSKGQEGFGASTVCGPLLGPELSAEASRPSCPALLLEAPARGGSTLSHVPQVPQMRTAVSRAVPLVQPSALGGPSAATAPRGSETAPAV